MSLVHTSSLQKLASSTRRPLRFLALSLWCWFGLAASAQANSLVDLSKVFLEKTIQQEAVAAEVAAYAKLPFDSLRHGLHSQAEKLAFWINTYNAFIIYTLRQDSAAYNRTYLRILWT